MDFELTEEQVGLRDATRRLLTVTEMLSPGEIRLSSSSQASPYIKPGRP